MDVQRAWGRCRGRGGEGRRGRRCGRWTSGAIGGSSGPGDAHRPAAGPPGACAACPPAPNCRRHTCSSLLNSHKSAAAQTLGPSSAPIPVCADQTKRNRRTRILQFSSKANSIQRTHRNSKCVLFPIPPDPIILKSVTCHTIL